MNSAIIGTGFLGSEIARLLWGMGEPVSLVTHHTKPVFTDSVPFDFFRDDIGCLLVSREVDTVFLPAKIEFTEDQHALRRAMERFIEDCGKRRIVYLSSDGIFDGQGGMYRETDVPMPVTNYGRNLLLCETLVRQAPNFVIIRPSYIYGFSGDVLDSRIARAVELSRKGEHFERFIDMYKSPRSVQEVAMTAIRIVQLQQSPMLIHIGGPRMSVYQFTREALEALGLSTHNLVGVPMPKERPEEFLRDTSLSFGHAEILTGVRRQSIRENLAPYRRRFF